MMDLHYNRTIISVRSKKMLVVVFCTICVVYFTTSYFKSSKISYRGHWKQHVENYEEQITVHRLDSAPKSLKNVNTDLYKITSKNAFLSNSVQAPGTEVVSLKICYTTNPFCTVKSIFGSLRRK